MLTSLYLLIICAIGMLHPVRNALALEGLGGGGFYKVYYASAFVALAVVPFHHAMARLPARWAGLALALFFALNLLVFRAAYPGGVGFAVLFYGWHDLYSALLVSQFFLTAAQLLDVRTAKVAYPLIIGAGSVGASLGGAVTGFFIDSIGLPNLLLVAAGLTAVFAVGLPFVLDAPASRERTQAGVRRLETTSRATIAELLADRQLRLIAASVIVTVLVKQLVDYQFNALSAAAYVTPEAIGAFQGKFSAATQWLPLVAAAALGPLMVRWGVGSALLMLPAAMVLSNAALAIGGGLALAAVAKGSETTLRYSAERTAREILYLPVPERVRARAKPLIDVGLESGLGKALGAGVIFALLLALAPDQLAYVATALAVLWLALAVALRREYVRALARAVRRRAVTLTNLTASLGDADTRTELARALTGDDPRQIAFALDLLGEADAETVRRFGAELHGLLTHRDARARARAADLLARSGASGDPAAYRRLLLDDEGAVREAGVRLACAADPRGPVAVVSELLVDDDRRVRTATVACLTRGEFELPPATLAVGARLLAVRWSAAAAGSATDRLEVAEMAGVFDAPEGVLEALLADADLEVAAGALRGAGRRGHSSDLPRLIDALGVRELRPAAAEALVLCGAPAVAPLEGRLRDPAADERVRWPISRVLSRIEHPAAVDALLRTAGDRDLDHAVRARAVRALGRLHVRAPALAIGRDAVLSLLDSELAAATRYAAAAASPPPPRPSAAAALLEQALREAWYHRQTSAFRCLALLYAPDVVSGCYRAVAGANARQRASALELVEQGLGRALSTKLAPVLRPEPDNAGDGDAPSPALELDDDGWVARCAAAAHDVDRPTEGPPMDVIEKVFVLQDVNLFHGVASAHLALIAEVAEEVEADAGVVLLRAGEPVEALYAVISGTVVFDAATAPGVDVGQGGNRLVLGSLSLLDGAPTVGDWRVVADARLLRISRRDLEELLEDAPELAAVLLRNVAQWVRGAMAVTQQLATRAAVAPLLPDGVLRSPQPTPSIGGWQ